MGQRARPLSGRSLILMAGARRELEVERPALAIT